MKNSTVRCLLISLSTVLMASCSGSSDATKEIREKPVEKKSVEETYLELAETTKKCAMEDGEACYNLAKHFETQNESAGIPDNLKIMMKTQIRETYQKSCDYGYKPGCKKAKD